jgi:prepilin-type N-terminal cleavage/methylation domain-containing protein
MGMKQSHRASRCRRRQTRGFSLIELSIVTAILAIVSVLGLEAVAVYTSRRAYTITQDKVAAVDVAIKKFYASYGRLPCPTVITNSMIGASTNGGTEDCSGVSIVKYGGVPYITLGLPMSAAIDGYTSKFGYLVTNSLTTAALFDTATSVGRIEVRTGKLEQPCSTVCEVTFQPSASTGAAYAILSFGGDQRGALGKNGATLKACVPSTGPPNIYDARIDTANCGGATSPTISPGVAGDAVVFDSRFNTGSVEASYFDDIILVRGKGNLQ